MPHINTSPRIAHPDDLYQMLIDAHEGLGDAASMKLNAKLVLLFANHIGDMKVIAEAIKLAREASLPDSGTEAAR